MSIVLAMGIALGWAAWLMLAEPSRKGTPCNEGVTFTGELNKLMGEE